MLLAVMAELFQLTSPQLDFLFLSLPRTPDKQQTERTREFWQQAAAQEQFAMVNSYRDWHPLCCVTFLTVHLSQNPNKFGKGRKKLQRQIEINVSKEQHQ